MLQEHLATCAPCRDYARDILSLDFAIGRALRKRWSAPRRSPIDTAAGVKRRLRSRRNRQFAVGLARIALKIGSLAMMTIFVGGLLRSPVVTHRGPAAIPHYNWTGIPRFELAEIGEGDYAANPSGSEDVRIYPASPSSRLHASQY
jgi:hypothetical protein